MQADEVDLKMQEPLHSPDSPLTTNPVPLAVFMEPASGELLGVGTLWALLTGLCYLPAALD